MNSTRPKQSMKVKPGLEHLTFKGISMIKNEQLHTPTSDLETIFGALALHQSISGDECRILRNLKRSHEELLEACKEAIKLIINLDDEVGTAKPIINKIRKAIAKAEAN